MMSFFGTLYNAPFYESAPWVDRPVGSHCAMCEELISETDDGFVDEGALPIHRHCLIAAISYAPGAEKLITEE